MATDTAVREFTSLTKDMGDKIVQLTLKQAKELSDYLEDVHGIKPAAGGAIMMAAAVDAPAKPEEKTAFDVILEGFGEKKISVIKEIRSITALGLVEAKALVEGFPSRVKEGVSKEDAEKVKAQLEAAGATVSIK